MKVRSVDCQSGPVRMPRVVVNCHAPVEATPEAIAERDKSKSKRELTARVRARARTPKRSTPFPAQWKRVSLSRGAVDLEPGDCELIDELRRKVLPKLAVRVVKDNTHCTPQQLTLGQPQLEVEALVERRSPTRRSEETKLQGRYSPSGTEPGRSCRGRRPARRGRSSRTAHSLLAPDAACVDAQYAIAVVVTQR